ncbi:MAG TPA: hypothetical protein VLV86_10560, partial [Vicinamibacterales bacterium]|nr:hypothetical protein [Vicinamibacterales bacterium]
MAGQLAVSAVGAVTAIGLDAPQFCAAFRAGISGIRRIAFQPPPEALLPAAPIPGRRILRPSEHAWLLNLASRAIHETLDRTDLRPETIVLLLSLPEPFRGHPAFFQNDPQEFVAVIESRLGIRFAAGSRILVDGHAAPLR